MSRGRRYDNEPKLNYKKVVAVIIAILVVIMFVVIIKNVLVKGKDSGKISSKSYFTCFEDNKFGVIDNLGNEVIAPSYAEMIVIPNSKEDIFLCTYDVNYETGEYKTKVLNSKNEEILQQYDKVEAIINHDNNNNMWYEEGVLVVKKDDKYGLIDFYEKEVLNIEYEEIIAVQGIENAFRVKKDGKYGVVDNKGKMLLNTEYADVTNLGKDNKAGYIVKNAENKYGIVDYSNNVVLEMKYDSIEKTYGNDLYVVVENGIKKVIQKDGQEVISTGFDQIIGIGKEEGENQGFIFEKDGKKGYIRKSGEVLIENIYQELKETKNGIFIAEKDNKYGIIDINKEQKLDFTYNLISYDEKADIYTAEKEDLTTDIINNNFEVKLSGILINLDTEKGYIELRVGEDYKYYNLKFEEKDSKDIFATATLILSKKDGKYGFVDREGNVIVDYIYDDATKQNIYGYAGIKKDGKWGSIDSKGKVVIEPSYDLEDYYLVDFIGEWHLGLDINMNYYNKL